MLLRILIVLTGTVFGMLDGSVHALASEVPCRFKAETEPAEIQVLADGKTRWAGTIEKRQTKTIAIPEGPFTVISKVFNPNLKTKGDIRAEMHTRLCREHVTFDVPLFSEEAARQ